MRLFIPYTIMNAPTWEPLARFDPQVSRRDALLPPGWSWTDPEWHPLDDPVWKWVRMATDGRSYRNIEGPE